MSASITRTKKLGLGLLVAAVVLVASFAGVEALLRGCGVGHAAGFVRETRDDAGRRWWRENRWVTAPYFPPELVRRPQPFRLARPKPPGTYRIVVLGSSAAMGDPEPAFAFGRVLDVLLRDAYPEIRFEIVNAGITAINSHVVRSIAADCGRLEPDLFIVYEGNNEVIGPYGPGTVFGPFFRSPTALRAVQTLATTRIGQILAAVARRLGPDRAALREWGGMQMFLRHEISRDDPRLRTTANHFRENLRAIAEAGRRGGAAVMLCTVPTNQKDFPPFRSRHRIGLSARDQDEWRTLFHAGQEAATRGEDAVAEQHYRAALAIDDEPAELHFFLGRLLLRQKRQAEAAELFQRALDRDVLRFRTDSALNEIIREAARGAADAELVDLARELARQSPDGTLGDALLYEHVHLNFPGAYAVARQLFPRIETRLIERRLIAARGAREPMSLAEARRRLAYTTYEQAMIIKELRARFSGPPFSGQSGSAERLQLYADRETAATHLLARPEVRDDLVHRYTQAIAERPDDWLLERNAGMAMVALGFADRGRKHLERVAAIIPDDVDTLVALGTALRALGDIAAAEKQFAAARELEPRYPGLQSGSAEEPPPQTRGR